jgi:hypothetical protein
LKFFKQGIGPAFFGAFAQGIAVEWRPVAALSLANNENVMLDTSKMTPKDVAALKAEGDKRGWGDKVQWYGEGRTYDG